MTAGRFSSLLARRSAGPLVVIAALVWVGLAICAITFPPLTGRVMDEAGVLSAGARDALSSKLGELEAKSGIQLVVATVNSLQGEEIEPYANALFRTWKLGEKDKNNGVLLLVAPNQHRVRIEVGYGLEGTLTDALSKIIIANAIAPRFKAGDFDGGVSRGVDDIITVLTTDAAEWQHPSLRLDRQDVPDWAAWFLLAAAIALMTLLVVSPGFRWLFLNVVLNILLNSGGGYRGGFPGGGGFRGGGGSSGGGGASGSW
jgi:uncharacterized protein